MNALQIAATEDMSDSVLGYFMQLHTVLNNSNELKQLPKAVFIMNKLDNFE